jgi:hypothetical protein
MKGRGDLYSQKWNCAALLFYNVRSPNLNIHVSVSDLYIPRIGVPILLQPITVDKPVLRMDHRYIGNAATFIFGNIWTGFLVQLVPNPVLPLFYSSSCLSAFCYFFQIFFLDIHLHQFLILSLFVLCSLFQILFLCIHLPQFSSTSSFCLPSLPCSTFQLLFLFIHLRSVPFPYTLIPLFHLSSSEHLFSVFCPPFSVHVSALLQGLLKMKLSSGKVQI